MHVVLIGYFTIGMMFMCMLNPLVSEDEPFGFCFCGINTKNYFTELVT